MESDLCMEFPGSRYSEHDLKGGKRILGGPPAVWEEDGQRIVPYRVGTQVRCPSCPGLLYYFWFFDLSTTFIPQCPTYLHCSHSWAQFHFGPSNPQNGKSLLTSFFYFNSQKIHLYLLFSQWITISFVNFCRQASTIYSLTQLTSFQSISKTCLYTYFFVLSFTLPFIQLIPIGVHYWSVIGDTYNRV